MHPALADLPHELDSTRRLLARVPDEHLGWRPHERSWTLGELASHVANLLTWQAGILREDHYDLGGASTPAEPPRSTGEILDAFDTNRGVLEAALEGVDDEAMRAEWRLMRGEDVIMAMPRAAALRTAGLSHLIHHRGQLTVYLRLLDVPLPPLYGPTADEGGSRPRADDGGSS